MISVKTVRWQCSGCDHLCAMLVDESVNPETLVVCPNSKWRIEKISRGVNKWGK